MKKLQEIKDEYAISKGENSWDDFKSFYHRTEVLDSMDEIAKIYANQNLDEAASYANGHRTKQAILNLKDEI